MKLIRIIIFFSLLLISCEPTYKIYLLNHNQTPVDIKVKLEPRHSSANYDIDSLYYEDKIMPRINEWTRNKLYKKIPVDTVDNESYSLKIKSNSTTLLEPSILIPIREIIINDYNNTDTLILYGKNNNFREWKKNDKLKRKSIYLILYAGYTTIVHIKD